MERNQINLAFIRLEHFLEQCVKLKGPNPPPLPTHEMAHNITKELSNLLDSVPEITVNDIPSVAEVISCARLKDIPGIHKYSDNALEEFLVTRSKFIQREMQYQRKFSKDSGLRLPLIFQADNGISKGTNYYNASPRRPNSKLGMSLDTINSTRMMEDKLRRGAEISARLSNNPTTADLNDMNRPTKLVERFNKLYTNAWTDAFEELQKLYKFQISGDEKAILELSTILKRAFEFTQDMAEIQRVKISKLMQNTMINPSKDKTTGDDIDLLTYDNSAHSELRFSTYAKQCIKDNADLSIPALIKNFNWEIRREHLRDILTNPYVKAYCNKCVELTWLMSVQDPPMILMWPKDVRRSELTEMFRYFTQPGSNLKHEVWPALLLTKDGPLLNKGVAQFK